MPEQSRREPARESTPQDLSFQVEDGGEDFGSNAQQAESLGQAPQQGGQSAEHAALPPNTRGGFTARALQRMGRSEGVEDVLSSGRLSDVATRAEVAVIAARLLGLGTGLEGQPGVFSDVPLSHWAAAAIYRCREEGIFTGAGDNRFNPDAPLAPEHAPALLERLANPGARAAFDRGAAVKEAAGRRQTGDANEDVASAVGRSLANYEGTAPDQIHYDSGIVNWGIGSNTGSHIARLLEVYERVANERGLTEQLYGHFRGRANFESIRDRFRRQGQGASISAAETGYLRSLGRDRDLLDAQYIKKGEDVARYINQVARFDPPYPFKDGAGTISELAAHVFSHAAHQAGTATRVYDSVMAGVGERRARGMSERDFLTLVRDKVVSWVQSRYRVGVTNRYNQLFREYGGSTRRYQLGGSGGGTRAGLEGQVLSGGAGVGGLEVVLVGPDGSRRPVETNAAGFFSVEAGLAPGRYTVEAGGARGVVDVTAGQVGWAQVDLANKDSGGGAGQGTGAGQGSGQGTGAGQGSGQGTGSGQGSGQSSGGARLDLSAGPLRRGSRGDQVVALQELLKAQGASLDADGDFGPATERAVRAFQEGRGLTVDGVVGPQTAAALQRAPQGTGAGGQAPEGGGQAPEGGGKAPEGGGQAPEGGGPTVELAEEDRAAMASVEALFAKVAEGELKAAREGAASFAAAFRQERGLAAGVAHPVTDALGLIWQIASNLGQAQEAMAGSRFTEVKDKAHQAAERARELRDRRLLRGDLAERVIQAAGGWWSRANEAARAAGQGEGSSNQRRGRRQSAFTTGRPRPGAGVISTELPRNGGYDADDFLAHHSDRSNSWAARQMRNDKNREVQAYDFTFLELDERGNIKDGSQLGLELITPWDARVKDIQKSYEGSGGLGRFIRLEDIETGLQISVHHLDTVGDFREGQILPGGTVFGTQGGSGNGRHSYAVHVDIVGTEEAVLQFVRANHTGEFRKKIEDPR